MRQLGVDPARPRYLQRRQRRRLLGRRQRRAAQRVEDELLDLGEAQPPGGGGRREVVGEVTAVLEDPGVIVCKADDR